MLRSILVPLDGSRFAEDAIPLALNIADRAGASLELLHVHEHFARHDPHASWLPYELSEDAQFRTKEQEYLDATVKRWQTTASIPVTGALVSGAIQDAILRRVQEKRSDLVVMATHGRSPLSRLYRGSVAEALVLNAPAPVLLVHAGQARNRQAPWPPVKRIVMPLDGSMLAERVLGSAVAIGSLMRAEFTLVRTIAENSFLDGIAAVADPRAIECCFEQRVVTAQAYLRRVAKQLQAAGSRIRTCVVSGKGPAAAVLDVARFENADLVALATRGRCPLLRLLLGSVAESIALRSTAPVLMCRAAGVPPLGGNAG